MARSICRSLVTRSDRELGIFVAFGRFIVQRLQAIWFGVHFYRRPLWISSQGATKAAGMDSGSGCGGIGHRPQLHFGYGTRQEKRVPPNHGSYRARIRDFFSPTCQGLGSLAAAYTPGQGGICELIGAVENSWSSGGVPCLQVSFPDAFVRHCLFCIPSRRASLSKIWHEFLLGPLRKDSHCSNLAAQHSVQIECGAD
jgi:hypothetical protein